MSCTWNAHSTGSHEITRLLPTRANRKNSRLQCMISWFNGMVCGKCPAHGMHTPRGPTKLLAFFQPRRIGKILDSSAWSAGSMAWFVVNVLHMECTLHGVPRNYSPSSDPCE